MKSSTAVVPSCVPASLSQQTHCFSACFWVKGVCAVQTIMNPKISIKERVNMLLEYILLDFTCCEVFFYKSERK